MCFQRDLFFHILRPQGPSGGCSIFLFWKKYRHHIGMTDRKLVHTRQCFLVDKLRNALWTLPDPEKFEKDRLYHDVHVSDNVRLYEDWERACAAFDASREEHTAKVAKARGDIEEFRRSEQWADVCERCRQSVAQCLEVAK